MSKIYSVGCKDCFLKLWIGQGDLGGVDFVIYSGEKYIDRLREFLKIHKGHNLTFNDDNYFYKPIEWIEQFENDDILDEQKKKTIANWKEG